MSLRMYCGATFCIFSCLSILSMSWTITLGFRIHFRPSSPSHTPFSSFVKSCAPTINLHSPVHAVVVFINTCFWACNFRCQLYSRCKMLRTQVKHHGIRLGNKWHLPQKKKSSSSSSSDRALMSSSRESLSSSLSLWISDLLRPAWMAKSPKVPSCYSQTLFTTYRFSINAGTGTQHWGLSSLDGHSPKYMFIGKKAHCSMYAHKLQSEL